MKRGDARAARLRGAAGSGAALASALCALACSTPRAGPPDETPRYAYAIAPPPAGSWTLRVEATFERAPSPRLVAPEGPGAFHDVATLDRGASAPVAMAGGAWTVPGCRARCTVGYAVDLDALASACRRLDCGLRAGDAFLSAASAWMLRPEAAGDAVVHVRVVTGDPSRVATGLRRDPAGGYVLRARELGEASYTAFGSLRRAEIDVPGAHLDVSLLGAPPAMGDGAVVRWIRDGASCVARLFGRFPVDAAVFVVPAPGADGVVFGRVMSLSGASVALLFGSATTADREARDWVVVHELFHLGGPSFVGEGRWLEEGLATYYEPVLRARSGWISPAALWSHLRDEMPRGLREDGEPPALEDRRDIDSTYWGGAIFALLADVRIREATAGARSLDDVLRAVLARDGDATHVSRVADFVREGDEVTGTSVLSDLYASWVERGENVDLDALWKALGVAPGALRDDAPLAALRRAIAAGPSG